MFYNQGSQHALSSLGLVKTAALPINPQWLMARPMIGGALKGMGAGALTGGVSGAIAAPEDQGLQGAFRGALGGGLFGGLFGGGRAAVRTHGFAARNPNFYRNTSQRMMEQQKFPSAFSTSNRGVLPGSQGPRYVDPTMRMNRVTDALMQGSGRWGLAGGLAGGVGAGLMTPERSTWDKIKSHIPFVG